MLERIREELKTKLSPHRFAHTESVVITALEFLMQVEPNVSAELKSRVELAAWLHDCAKELKNDEQVDLAKYYGIEIYPEDLLSPNLLHARNGAAIAEEKYEIMDPRVLSAIRDHTLGAIDMGLEAKILYLADMLEPGRDAAIKAKTNPGANELSYSRELDAMRATIAAGKLNEALLMAMDSKISYVIRKRQPIHPLGVMARNSLI